MKNILNIFYIVLFWVACKNEEQQNELLYQSLNRKYISQIISKSGKNIFYSLELMISDSSNKNHFQTGWEKQRYAAGSFKIKECLKDSTVQLQEGYFNYRNDSLILAANYINGKYYGLFNAAAISYFKVHKISYSKENKTYAIEGILFYNAVIKDTTIPKTSSSTSFINFKNTTL